MRCLSLKSDLWFQSFFFSLFWLYFDTNHKNSLILVFRSQHSFPNIPGHLPKRLHFPSNSLLCTFCRLWCYCLLTLIEWVLFSGKCYQSSEFMVPSEFWTQMVQSKLLSQDKLWQNYLIHLIILVKMKSCLWQSEIGLRTHDTVSLLDLKWLCDEDELWHLTNLLTLTYCFTENWSYILNLCPG